MTTEGAATVVSATGGEDESARLVTKTAPAISAATATPKTPIARRNLRPDGAVGSSEAICVASSIVTGTLAASGARAVSSLVGSSARRLDGTNIAFSESTSGARCKREPYA